MAPKKNQKTEKANQKSTEKQKAKIVEDKTFGLKNKNKSKAVQKYIKEVTSQIKGNQKGGLGNTQQKLIIEKEEKKKQHQQQMLLASLFKSSESIRKASDKVNDKKLKYDDSTQVSTQKYDPKLFRNFQKIDLYVDQRILKNIDGYESIMSSSVNTSKYDSFIASVFESSQILQTDIVCKYFLDAVEKKQYGWFWVCPNGGDECKYRHCLPPGYVTQVDKEEEEEIAIEEQIEIERQALPPSGKLVTLETFTIWKENQMKKKEVAVTEIPSSGVSKMTGKDLFMFNPSVFIDDESAACENEYEENEDYWNESHASDQDKTDEINYIPEGNVKREYDPDEYTIKLHKDYLFLDDVPEDLDNISN